jgi:hypothetical protein
MDGYLHIGTTSMEGQVQWDAWWDWPATFKDVSLEVNAQQLSWVEFFPGQIPRVTKQGAVAQVVGEVSSDVVVISLSPKRSGKQYELLSWRQLRDEFIW